MAKIKFEFCHSVEFLACWMCCMPPWTKNLICQVLRIGQVSGLDSWPTQFRTRTRTGGRFVFFGIATVVSVIQHETDISFHSCFLQAKSVQSSRLQIKWCKRSVMLCFTSSLERIGVLTCLQNDAFPGSHNNACGEVSMQQAKHTCVVVQTEVQMAESGFLRVFSSSGSVWASRECSIRSVLDWRSPCVNARLSTAIVCATHLCVRGSRVPDHKISIHCLQQEDRNLCLPSLECQLWTWPEVG